VQQFRRWHRSCLIGPTQITLEGHGRPIAAGAGDTVLASLLRAQAWDDIAIRRVDAQIQG
jgi:hypothetical protein